MCEAHIRRHQKCSPVCLCSNVGYSFIKYEWSLLKMASDRSNDILSRFIAILSTSIKHVYRRYYRLAFSNLLCCIYRKPHNHNKLIDSQICYLLFFMPHVGWNHRHGWYIIERGWKWRFWCECKYNIEKSIGVCIDSAIILATNRSQVSFMNLNMH